MAADFNRDGRPDLATAGTGSASVAILINDTRMTGGFRRTANIVVGGGPFEMATGDINRDGNPDLVIANADSDAVTILTGRGDGTFNAKRDIAVGGNPRGIALADVNGDGRLDILVTQFTANTWTLLLGDGGGGVTTKTTYKTASKPQGIVAADLNRDGKIDVVIANAGSAVVSVFSNAGRSNQTRRDTAVPVPVNVLTTGDFNRDGWIDVAGASTDRSSAVIVRGSASGLTGPVSISTGSSPRGIIALDLNQDGRLDIAIANRASSTVTVHFGRGDGTFADTATLAAGSGSRAIVGMDFDRDGLVDLATVNELDGTASFFTNVTTFVHTGQVFSRRQLGQDTGNGGAGSLVMADFDQDGRPDLVEVGAPPPRLFFGNGRQLDLPDGFPGALAVADLDLDGHADILTSDFSENDIKLYLGDGKGGFTAQGPVVAIPSPGELELGDFNRDGRLDAVTESFEEATGIFRLQMLLGRGDGTFDAGPVLREASHSNGLVVADIDRDGRLDLVTDEFNPAGLRVRYGDGNGGFRSSNTFVPLPDGGADVRAADFDGDGRLDLAVPLFTGIAVVLANASGFDAPVTYTFPDAFDAFPFRVGVGDYDLDGDVDILTNEADVLVNQGDGTFKPLMFAGFGDRPVIADFNGDGLPDLLLANPGSLTILVAERNEKNRPPTVSAGPDITVPFQNAGGEFSVDARASDPDQHDVHFEWRDSGGQLLGTRASLSIGNLKPGTYTLTVTVFDDRGGKASDSMRLVIQPFKEIYAHVANLVDVVAGGWQVESDPTAADGVRLRHPDAGGAKLNAPLADPVNYFEFAFKADPTQAYKLWIRGKADRNSPSNDSVFIQFTGAVDASGKSAWEIGTTDALVFNLEECAGCGISGWGWEDDAWGAKNANGGLIRFPAGGFQRIRIQTREDGLSIDQIVLSSGTYLNTRPGAVKNDTKILPATAFPDDD